MPVLREYYCACGVKYEFLHHPSDEPKVCPTCGGGDATQVPGGHLFSTIVPMYRGSKKMKAGHQHTHADRPAEKGSVSVPKNFTS